MLSKERRTVTDADNAHLREFPAQQFVHLLLARFIKCRSRLIEEHPVRTHEQDTCKGQTLLLS